MPPSRYSQSSEKLGKPLYENVIFAFVLLMELLESCLHLGPSPIYENPSEFGQLTRGGELRSSKKSVTFDKQLESIAVYSPPGTPHDSLSSGGLTVGRNRSPIENIPLNRPIRLG